MNSFELSTFKKPGLQVNGFRAIISIYVLMLFSLVYFRLSLLFVVLPTQNISFQITLFF